MRQPTILIGLGSGREGRLRVELDCLRFTLEVDGGKPAVESLSLAELKNRFPNASGLVAEVVAEAIRSQTPDPR